MNARPEDWVFVDWAPINNKGDVSLIQILFARSLEVMALIAGLCGDENGRVFYHDLWQKCLKTALRCSGAHSITALPMARQPHRMQW